MSDFKLDGPSEAPVTLLLAHGAGGSMVSMNACTKALSAAGLSVARFEFAYMAARRSRRKKPPPRAESLKNEYLEAVGALQAKQPLVIGGKSMGGRVASMVADELHAVGKVAGLLCLGYPVPPRWKARTWASIATLLQTCKMNGVGRCACTKLTLERIANRWPNSDIEALMPWNFKPLD